MFTHTIASVHFRSAGTAAMGMPPDICEAVVAAGIAVGVVEVVEDDVSDELEDPPHPAISAAAATQAPKRAMDVITIVRSFIR